MQESYHRITIKLDGPLIDRREEMLSKIERFKNDLKERGHSGRYGLNNLVCFSSIATHATCLASTTHPEESPWLEYELSRLAINEGDRRKRLENNIDDQIKSFNRHRDKEKFIAELKPSDYTDFGMTYNKNQKQMEPEEYIRHLEELRKQPLNYTGFSIDTVFIEPIKPSKTELANEQTFLKHLEEVPTERKKYEEALMKKIKGPVQISEDALSKSAARQAEARARMLKKNFDELT